MNNLVREQVLQYLSTRRALVRDSNIPAGTGEDGPQNASILIETLGSSLFAALPTVSVLKLAVN